MGPWGGSILGALSKGTKSSSSLLANLVNKRRPIIPTLAGVFEIAQN
jgi:hypothetical protein